MELVKPPEKPFPSYKWRWAVLTPTESLNDPPVFLGILRVFNRFQDFRTSSREIKEGIDIVLEETNSPIGKRTEDRNIIRNSGQYWKALGLVEPVRGIIRLSDFGRLLAHGKITQ